MDEEKIMWGVVTFADGKFYIAAMRNRVHVGFAVTGLSAEEIGLFEGNGKTMRHIKVPTIESINRESLVNLIKMVDKKATANQAKVHSSSTMLLIFIRLEEQTPCIPQMVVASNPSLAEISHEFGHLKAAVFNRFRVGFANNGVYFQNLHKRSFWFR